MTDILLVQPPIRDFYLTLKRTIPYGLSSIAAALKNDGFNVTLFDALASKKSKPIEMPETFSHLNGFYKCSDLSMFSLFHQYKHFGYSFEHIGKTARDINPILVGISSCFTPYADEAIETAHIIKKFLPTCKIVLGGHHPTVFFKETLEHTCVDFVLRGEGEASMPLLAKAVKNGLPLDKIPGMAYENPDGSMFISEPDWINDLTTLPLPDMTLVNSNFYRRNGRRSTTIVASRGCPMKCSYCSVSSTSAHGPFRQRDVKSILKEIEAQASSDDIGFIDFEDENLSLNKKWFLDLLEGINTIFKDNKIELRAMNGLYPPSLDEQIIVAMKAAGFNTLNLSLGSTSTAQLARFKRNDVIKAHELAVGLAQKHGLKSVSYIIAAAPGQTASSTLNDLMYIARLNTLAGLSIFYPAPGSLDYGYCEKNNLLPGHFTQMRSTALPISDTTTRLEAVTLLRLSRILNFIKHLKGSRQELPKAEPCSATKIDYGYDREWLSISLLKWFLYDGKIRGVSKNGNVYEHLVDTSLTDLFAAFLKKDTVRPIISSDKVS